VNRLSDWVLGFDQIDSSQLALVGGKGANLGELSRLDGVTVPPGCCVTTTAYAHVVAGVEHLDELLVELDRLDPAEHDAVRQLAATVRRRIDQVSLPDDLVAAVAEALARLGGADASPDADVAFAVRSSATAEDLPTASFAGLQDTYLNVVGLESVLVHLRRCWASLFSERAVTYRARRGIDHRAVRMGVVIQRMVPAQVSGVVFTADPLTGRRTVASVEASFGLGEALVSGRVEPDTFGVHDGEVIDTGLGAKQLVIESSPGGGTVETSPDLARRAEPALSEPQVLRLVELARRIEAHFGSPQDIEWCLTDDEFQIVQSRPITTLYPVPHADDDEPHVYVSVGHGQMMTDAMTPLGLSVWRLTAMPPMHEAGGRLFVDVTARLASPATRAGLLQVMGESDPLLGDALHTVLERGDLLPPLPEDDGAAPGGTPAGAAPPVRGFPGRVPAPLETDRSLVTALIERREESLATLVEEIASVSGPELFDFIAEDIVRMKQLVFEPASHELLMAGMDAARWLNEHVDEWLGEKNVADTLSLAVPDNVTSEMGLALLDVADVIRPHAQVVELLEQVEANGDEDFLTQLDGLDGGPAARVAIEGFLTLYGMRCVGEIDITRPRWSECPVTLVPAILANVAHFEPGEAIRRVEQGRQQAPVTADEVLARVAELPDGAEKVAQTRQMIDRVRTFAGYREYPKFVIVNRHWVYKQALMAEAERLLADGAIDERDDVFFLHFDEFREAVRTRRVDRQVIAQRRDAFHAYESLTPPRVLTSEGEALVGAYRRDDVPEGALPGLAVSAGTVEGRARVLHDLADADLEPGDILVTAFTDPSWSPLFVSVVGLVTEVGGLMTHGAVIAREYGLPAVVGVEGATRLIQDGQRIRVHGTEGYVELLT
jgi:pyruvate,water dikinase